MLRPAVPSTQAGGKALKSSTAREPSSILRWVSMTRRMYAASLAPRLSRTSWRMASSSWPICSMSASVRCAIGLVWPRTAFFWIVVMSISSGGVVEVRRQWSMSQGPAAALMQVWMRTPPVSDSPGVTVVSAPLRRSRTAPSRSGRTQP